MINRNVRRTRFPEPIVLQSGALSVTSREWLPLPAIAQMLSCSVADAYVRLRAADVPHRAPFREETCLYGNVPLYDSAFLERLEAGEHRASRELGTPLPPPTASGSTRLLRCKRCRRVLAATDDGQFCRHHRMNAPRRILHENGGPA